MQQYILDICKGSLVQSPFCQEHLQNINQFSKTPENLFCSDSFQTFPIMQCLCLMALLLCRSKTIALFCVKRCWFSPMVMENKRIYISAYLPSTHWESISQDNAPFIVVVFRKWLLSALSNIQRINRPSLNKPHGYLKASERNLKLLT